MTMKNIIQTIALSIIITPAYAQPVEFLVGHQYIYYQHAITKSYKPNSSFGLMHIASTLLRYNIVQKETKMYNELMNQVYLRYKLRGSLAILGGFHFTTTTKFKPSIAFQYGYHKKELFVLLQPRIDIWQSPSYELFGLAEYKPRLSKMIALYSRIQFLTSRGAGQHGRSYQQFRLGIDYHSTQTGFGLQLDEYGPYAKLYWNVGVFIKKDIY